VADLVEAVMANNASILMTIPLSKLLVYKSRKSFDKRNSVEEKEEPLVANALIVGLGTSLEDALVVVVPSGVEYGAKRARIGSPAIVPHVAPGDSRLRPDSERVTSPNIQKQPGSVSPSRFVWVEIFESSRGERFENTRPIKISVDRAADVDDFLEAVRAVATSVLRGVDPPQILVYKNRPAFEKRIAVEGKEGPLEANSLVAGLGTSLEDALVVVVPSVVQSGAKRVRSIALGANIVEHESSQTFQLCAEPFYTKLPEVVEEHGFMAFEYDIPCTRLKKLYVRECYRVIASAIMEPDSHLELRKAIITGTPGIGKSLFLFYLLKQLIMAKKRVLLIYEAVYIYYDETGGVWEFTGHPTTLGFSFWTPTLWCLFDGKGRSPTQLGEFLYDRCNFIVSTSPRRDLINDFKKDGNPRFFFMPVWSEVEMLAIVPLFPDANGWSQRFESLGGVPRHVLQLTTETPKEIIEAACKACSLDDCIQIVGMNSTITEKSKAVHSLVHITSAHPFRKSSVCYASQTALDVIVREKGEDVKVKMYALVPTCEGNPLIASLCGRIFEQYAIELLEKGGTFDCRELLSGKAKTIPREAILSIPPSQQIVAGKVAPNQSRHVLHVPKSKNYTAIDAWIPGIGAFQMTVAAKHGFELSALGDLSMLGKGARKLYWCVPPSIYKSFTKQSPVSIEQYAVRIPNFFPGPT
jgi:hypothetical protein